MLPSKPFLDAQKEGMDLKGNLGRPLGTRSLLVPPNLRIDRDRIRWDPEVVSKWKCEEPTPKLLDEFLKLESKRDDPPSIVRFAERWGVLGLRQNPEAKVYVPRGPSLMIGGRSFELAEISEIESDKWDIYPRLAKRAAGMVSLIAALWGDAPELGAKEDWNKLDDHPEAQDVSPKKRESAEWRLWHSILRWLQFGRAEIGLRLFNYELGEKEPRPELFLGFQGTGLFGALALQIAMLASGAEGLYVCSGCKAPYFRTIRRPTQGKRNFCESCRRGKVPGKLATRAFRERTKKELEG